MAARPATRIRATDTAPRPAVRDLTGGAGVAIEWDVRPVFDFIFSLTDDAGTTDDLPAPDRGWLADARAALPSDVKRLRKKLFSTDIGPGISAFAFERRDLRTARQLVEALDATPAADIARSMVAEGWNEPGLGDLIERSLAGDRDALDQVADKLPEWHRTERLEFLADPEATIEPIRQILRAWLEQFEPIEERIAGILERDHAGRSADRASLATSELIEKTTGGIRWLPEQGIRRVTLAPTYFSRPFNILMGGRGWRAFAYPVADSALDEIDPMAPPQSLVRLHRALGDPTRLRILKLLSEKDLYLTEIAQLLELSKPTIKHHLALLRSAGLVTVTEAVTVLYYSLRRERLDEASSELKTFLLG
jgi:DNA-binding transcriptional ArsR family regulator